MGKGKVKENDVYDAMLTDHWPTVYNDFVYCAKTKTFLRKPRVKSAAPELTEDAERKAEEVVFFFCDCVVVWPFLVFFGT